MSAGPPAWASAESKSPEVISPDGDAEKRRKRPGSGSEMVMAVTLALIPGIALGFMYPTSNGETEALPRRPIHALERVQEARDAAELFQRQCVACHGKKGKGDGPAAAAMTPRPANLTDPERIGELSDEELIEVLTNGRGAMPSFGALLSPEEIGAIVRYIRELSGATDDQ